MTLNELKELIELVAEKGFAEFEVERSGFKLRIVANRAPEFVALEAANANAPLAVSPVIPAPAAVNLPIHQAVASLPAVPPAPASSPKSSQPTTSADAASGDHLKVVKSPIVGTFYRSASPTAEPFVKIGDQIDVGKVLCIVEAMKLMNEIESDVAGEVVKVFVENGQPVEYGQPLFGIRP